MHLNQHQVTSNVKADGKGTLEVQLAKDLKNIDSISNKDGQKIEFKDGGTTISGGNVSVDGNKNYRCQSW